MFKDYVTVTDQDGNAHLEETTSLPPGKPAPGVPCRIALRIAERFHLGPESVPELEEIIEDGMPNRYDPDDFAY